MIVKKLVFPFIFGLFCALQSAEAAERSLNFNFHLPGLRLNDGPPPAIKRYDGNRLRDDSLLMVYYHDLSVAVVELGPKKLLLNCNIIEIYSPTDVDKAMGPLVDKTTPVPINFNEMVHLMDQCVQLERMKRRHRTGVSQQSEEERKNFTTRVEEAKAIINSQLVLLSGIIPGTKWCGTGDIAKNYHDLGEDVSTDMCCRNHDLCPVKIRAYSKKYNLNNDSLYTKSHCTCDDIFHKCMKMQRTKSAQILGHIYFNLVKVPCLEDREEGKIFRKAKEF
ncbi:uncharacterized protein LOC123316617 [Coccinella septempunctata]|uniref:uncharacterized protein LOC123316617 n=1 Tax=Coccinella septempunctata TaxID=41139 RepID=UPI001D060B52|nr:uncharacterized protein LOC123316617 [Coccinella septempunctata]